MFLLHKTYVEETSAALEWKKFKEICSFITSVYLPDFDEIFFIENKDKEVETFFYNPATDINLSLEKILKSYKLPFFEQYDSLLNNIDIEKYPNYFTAWFYNQIKSLNDDIKTFFIDGKIATQNIHINLNNYDILWFFKHIFDGQHVESSHLKSIYKNIYLLKKYIDLPVNSLNESQNIYIDKNIISIVQYIRYLDKEEIESVILQYILLYGEQAWFMRLHRLRLINIINPYIRNIILEDKNEILNYSLNIINIEVFEKREILHLCCENNKYLAAISLLKNGFNVNYKSKEGITPLMISASLIDDKMVDILLENNADLDIEDNYGIIASEKIPNFDFANKLFLKMELIRKNRKGA